jgi:C4-type Zn-finger protein
MTCPVIGNHASYEIRAVVSILHAKSISAAEIHCELCVVCSQNVMSEGTSRRCRIFKVG